MILDPDFLDHWKTRLLIELMDDELASNYILRLWFHCQLRRTTTFEGMTGQVLKVVCRYNGDGDKLRETMLRVGFIEVDGDTVFVPKWAEANDKMAANWENGKKGGRPKKPAKTPELSPPKNPPETQPEPNDNPHITGREVGREEEKEGIKEIQRAPSVLKDEFPEPLRTKGFEEAWGMWESYRVESGHGVVQPITRIQVLSDLAKLGPQEAENKVRLAIKRQWKHIHIDAKETHDDASGTGKRPTSGANARRSIPGGDSFGDASRYDGSRVKVFRHDGKHGNEQSAIPPSQPASPSG